MKNKITQSNFKGIYIAFSLLLTVPSFAQVAAFDSDKPATTVVSTYTQDFTGGSTSWDTAFDTTFNNQWDVRNPNTFTATDISSGYLKYVWSAKHLIASKTVYATPYTMETDFDYNTGASNRGGIVLRANPSDIENIQQSRKDPGFNLVGIAIYPASATSMVVQFNGVLSGVAQFFATTPRAQIQVPKPAAVTSLFNRATLRVEDFGSSIYVYYNNVPFIRINITNPGIGNNSSGEVFDANMVSKGTFTGMEVLSTGKVSVAMRDATLRLYNSTVTTLKQVPLSVKENDLINFTLYPNPAKGIVNLSFDNKNGETATAAIFDIQGKLVKNIDKKIENNNSIDVSSLTKGVYFLKIQSASAEQTKKLIIE